MKGRPRPTQYTTDRRLFLKGVIAAGGATALTAVSAPHMPDPVEDKQAGPGENPGSVSKGYRETAHVKAYYRTLRD
ncbi:MAG: twin-arginine translocation signal domain-containing protein [Thiogranum sp.]